jgi:hypothetical protein
VFITSDYSCDQIKEIGMGTACGWYGVEQIYSVFWCRKLKGWDNLRSEDNIKINLKRYRMRECNWIRVARGRLF